MAFNIPKDIVTHLEGNNTNLIPLVLFGTYPDDWNNTNPVDLDKTTPFIGISTNDIYYEKNVNVTIFNESYNISLKENFLPLLINIPNLNEKFDLVTRKYQVSNVNLQISNKLFNGKRFSDLVATRSLVNMECRIYWISPNTDSYKIPSDIW